MSKRRKKNEKTKKVKEKGITLELLVEKYFNY